MYRLYCLTCTWEGRFLKSAAEINNLLATKLARCPRCSGFTDALKE